MLHVAFVAILQKLPEPMPPILLLPFLPKSCANHERENNRMGDKIHEKLLSNQGLFELTGQVRLSGIHDDVATALLG